MGYYANQYDAAFEIGESDVERACALLGLDPSLDGLMSAISELGFEIFADGKGGIDGVCFGGGSYRGGYIEETLSTLAPVVRDGSYIDFIGDDLCIWRLDFKNGEMKILDGTIVFS